MLDLEVLQMQYHDQHVTVSTVHAGDQAAAMSSKPVDALRTYVSEAQARANQIVNEFESMLLVTGAPSGQQATHMQPVAALTASSSDDGKRSHKVP